MKRILIIDDDQSICKELKELLDNSGYEGIILNDFSDVIAKIESINLDLILLDINIPFVNGEMLLHDIRSFSHVPIIMVTSRNNESDEVLSMSYGADDYITKPYNPTILLLHISAVLKRMEVSSDIIKYDDLTILSKKGIIKNESQELILTKNELLVFSFLYTNRGNIVSRDALMTELWNNDEYINDNALSVNISRLRNKLKELGHPNAIETRKGQGYILL